MTDLVDPAIMADPDASTTKRPRRTKTLTPKAQENLQSDETTSGTTKKLRTKVAQTTSISRNDGQDEGGEENSTDAGTTMLRKVFGVLQVLRDEFSKQQETTRSIVNDQQNTIRELERQLQENQRELKQAREQLDMIMKCPAMTTSTHTSPQASYAEMARTPPTSQPSNVQTLSTMNTTPSTFTDTLFCTVDKSRVGSDESTKVTAGTVRKAVEREVRATKDDKGHLFAPGPRSRCLPFLVEGRLSMFQNGVDGFSLEPGNLVQRSRLPAGPFFSCGRRGEKSFLLFLPTALSRGRWSAQNGSPGGRGRGPQEVELVEREMFVE